MTNPEIAAPLPLPLSILLVEDSDDDAELLEAALRRAGLRFALARVETEPEFLEALQRDRLDVVLCDFHLPAFSATRALHILAEAGKTMPVLVVSWHIHAKESAEMLRLGARRIIRKSQLDGLAPAIRGVLGA